MRAAALFVMLAACGGTRPTEATYHASVPGGDEGGGSARVGGGRFARGDVEKAIRAEKDALALIDQKVIDTENGDDGKDADAPVRLAALRADRAAGGAFVAQLEACEQDGDACPPSLDEPQIGSDFDAASGEMNGAPNLATAKWPDQAAVLERNACGCRTRACVDWVMADLARWEAAVPPDAQADEAAEVHVVGARACLWTRLGKPAHTAPAAPGE